jgi:hypothetical protein
LNYKTPSKLLFVIIRGIGHLFVRKYIKFLDSFQVLYISHHEEDCTGLPCPPLSAWKS